METRVAPFPAVRRPVLWRALRVGFWICTVIAILAVIRRLVTLLFPPATPSNYGNMDAAFSSHAALTLAHILPALCFVAIAPIVIFGKGPLARALERILFPLGAVVGLTAYAMSRFAIGGWVERAAVLVFNTWFLWCLVRAWRLARSSEEHSKRRWLLRSVATLLAIATTRPIMVVFFATSRLTHWQPAQFFGYAFWIGFSINVLLIEAYLRRPEAAEYPHTH